VRARAGGSRASTVRQAIKRCVGSFSRFLLSESSDIPPLPVLPGEGRGGGFLRIM
jgi:hypothetical protein